MSINGYTPIKVMGKGSFGTVYLCEDSTRKKHCIKEIQLPDSNMINSKTKDDMRHMVAREVYLLLNLQHPRIVRCKECFQEQDKMFIVMEYEASGNLHSLIESRKKYFDEKTVLCFFCDLLLGLEYLHLRRVIHRDIKPENILVGHDCRLKFADFGISKIYTDLGQTVIQPGTENPGTLRYMAPEALNSNYFSFDSDIWALGCVFYEICMLRQPFYKSKTMDELCLHTTNCILKPLPEHFSQEITVLINTMLHPRYKSRATINWIVAQPIITARYYSYYFRN